MYLTKENLKTIERYLRENGVKDSQFPSIEEATGDEYLVIDTALGNRRVKLKSIINLLEASGIEDSLNSDATNRSLSARQGKVLKEEILKLDENKQDSLKSGETIKTINGESILGEGNISITGSENTSQIYHWEKEVNEQGVITKEEYDAISKADIIIVEGVSGTKLLDPEGGTIIVNFHTGKGGFILEAYLTIREDLTYSFESLVYSIPSTEYIDNAIKEAITNTLTTEV